MEPISLAYKLVDTVRVVIAALKGETRLVLTCRQLLHSTQLYAECLQSVQDVWNDVNKNSSSSTEVKKSLSTISSLVSNDLDLLQKIKVEVDEIFKTNSSKSLIQNALLSQWTGRIERIHRMENELMNRFQLITTIMVKDVFQSNNSLDEATMQLIGDVDGSVFWHSNFGKNKSTTFQFFVDAYQDYISKTLFFRRLARAHLITLLAATLLPNSPGSMSKDRLLSEVSVAQFALWLRRFGPMRETLAKASALSIPSTEQSVPWFQKEFNRDQATALLEHNFHRFGAAVLPHHLIILRYSSDPKNHFVITCRHLSSSKMEHFPIVNAAQGYCISGDEDCAFPTIVELIQRAVIDRLYATALSDPYTFPRDSLNEWEVIFEQATATLPEGHYGNRSALEKAAMEMLPFERNEQSGCEASSSSSISYGFATLFSSNDTPALAYPSSSSKGVVSATTNHRQSTTIATTSEALNEKKIIGKYLIKQGLDLLEACGEVQTSELASFFSLLNKL